MSYIARQPNGLLCRFSTVVDAPTHYNLTEKEYIELCAEQAREEARYNLKQKHFIKPFENVLKDIRFDNISEKEWQDVLEKMNKKEEKE